MKNFKNPPKKYYNLFEVLKMLMIMSFLRPGIRLRGTFATKLTIVIKFMNFIMVVWSIKLV